MTLRSRSLNEMTALFAVVLTGLVVASVAEARPENMRWTHSRPTEVQRFEVRVSAMDGSSSQIMNLGVPSRGSNGIYQADVEVGSGDVRLEMRAFGPGLVASTWTPAQTRLDGSAGGGGGGGGTTTVPVSAGTVIPPIVGSAGRFDFGTDAVGPNVNGWFDTRANNSLVENNTLFDIVEIGTNRILHTSSAQTAIHSHARDASSVWSNFVLTGRMATDESTGILGVTTYSEYPSADRYYRLSNAGGGSFILEGRPALSCSATDTGITPSAGSWYNFAFDVVDRGSYNQVRAKVWLAGTSEPSIFQVDCNDATSGRPQQGTIGVYSAGIGQKYWDDLEIVQGSVVPTQPPAPPVLIQVVPAQP